MVKRRDSQRKETDMLKRMGENDDKCRNCLFWDGAGHYGVCCRHAPTLGIAQCLHETGATLFPATEMDDWCGDFEQKGK